MGLRLRHPFMAGASPLSAHLDGVRQREDAGAAALEVNFYEVVTDFSVSAMTIERDIISAVVTLKHSLGFRFRSSSPYFTAFGNGAHRLDEAGADGLVIFNRFYQLRNLTTALSLELSRTAELLLRLRWLAILHGRIRPLLAVTGGIETVDDGVKAILAGAHAGGVCAASPRTRVLEDDDREAHRVVVHWAAAFAQAAGARLNLLHLVGPISDWPSLESEQRLQEHVRTDAREKIGSAVHTGILEGRRASGNLMKYLLMGRAPISAICSAWPSHRCPCFCRCCRRKFS